MRVHIFFSKCIKHTPAVRLRIHITHLGSSKPTFSCHLISPVVYRTMQLMISEVSVTKENRRSDRTKLFIDSLFKKVVFTKVEEQKVIRGKS